MAVKASGLIFTPILNPRGITALDIWFEPAMVISARKLDTLGRDIRSMKEPLKRSVKEVMIPSIRKNFQAGGRDPKWEALADSTIRRRNHDGFRGSKPLIKSGKLRRVMGQQKVWTIDKEKAYIQDLPNEIWYGKVHQGGASFTVRGGGLNIDQEALSKFLSYGGKKIGSGVETVGDSGDIPARPFVVLRRMDEIRIQKIFNDWLGERIRAARLSGRG